MNFSNYSDETYSKIIIKNHENAFINTIFVIFLLILITIGNLLMGCEVKRFKLFKKKNLS